MKKLVPYICVVCVCVIIAVFSQVVLPSKQTRFWHHEVKGLEYCLEIKQDEFCTHLPLVEINTNNQKITKAKEVLAKIKVVDHENGHNHFGDGATLETDTLIKVRGNSSAYFDKKQYRLTFVDTSNYDKTRNNVEELEHVNHKVMGMAGESEWVLNGPVLDKTCLRNYLMYNLSGEIMDWAPNVRFCEVFLDNEYKGLYLMVEAIKADENRVDIKMVNDKNPITDYMVVRERYGRTPYELDVFGQYTYKNHNELGLIYPGEKSGRTPEQIEFIRQDMSKFEKTLYSLDYDDQVVGYKSLIDVQSFVDYYILNEFAMNIDSGSYSTYLHKDLRKGFKMGPVWDFNNSFNNYQELSLDVGEFYSIDNPWYIMLIKDEEFVEFIINRYHFLRKSMLSDDRLFEIIDDTIEFLGPAIQRNEEVWGYLYQVDDLINVDVYGEKTDFERNPRSYDEAISKLKNCIKDRGAFLDDYIHVLRQFCAESKVKEWN